MSDTLTRGFRSQLTTSMDVVLKRTVLEVMNIFENTVYEYRMQLSYKVKEVSELKAKLQTAELRLQALLHGKDGGQEITQVASETQTPSEAPTQTRTQSTDVSEVDAVPEDWCEPVSSETMSVQDVGESPGVKLRPLSISLWNLPVRKTEGGYCGIDSHLKTWNSTRFTASNNPNMSRIKTFPVPNLEQESPDQAQLEDLRRRKKMSAGEVKKQTVKRKKNKKAAEARSTEVNTVEKNVGNMYPCKVCNKVYESDYGLHEHARIHKQCSGCKKIFPSKRLFICHKLSCRKLKVQVPATTSPPELSHEGENALAASKKLTAINKKRTPSLGSKLATNKGASTSKYACPHCDETYANPFLLKQHVRVHFSKKLTPCTVCSKMFRNKKGMKIHRAKAHENKMNASDGTEDLAWTEPVEEIDNEPHDLISIHSKSCQKSSPSDEEKQNSVINVKLQTTGQDTQKGSSCLLCLKRFENNYALIEHMASHK
ncbi:zinc finger protein 445-like [Salarias fasciatus]|uniref:zinc finger protein 445-like n=1 Tax=Salarias fasciatus TaxID=181472 RepID=UPI001176B9B7|nr:zinc finger protein 445-like [Salarias fasciatus]